MITSGSMDPSALLDQTLQDISNLQAEFDYYLKEIGNSDIKIFEKKKKMDQKENQLFKFIKQNGSLMKNPNEDEINEFIFKDLENCNKIQQEKCLMANTALFTITKKLRNLQRQMEILEADGVLAAMEEDSESATELSREGSISSIAGNASTNEKKRKATNSTTITSSTRRKNQPARPASRQTNRENQTSQISETSTTITTTVSNNAPTNSTVTTHKKRKTISNTNANNTNANVNGANSNNISNLSTRDSTLDLDDYKDNLFDNGTSNSNNNSNEDEDKNLYCFCQRFSFGEMVACDGPNCKYEWFHYGCVNLKEPPKGTWYCPDCKAEMENTKKKKS